MSINYITSAEMLSQGPSGGVTPIAESEWERLKPDLHLTLVGNDRLCARCSIWQNSLRSANGARPAAIGHFDASDPRSGKTVLEAACNWLAEKGSTQVVGPINANTWNKYRLVTYSNGRPQFLMEPYNPTFYVDAWTQAGFDPLVEYYSTEESPSIEPDPRLKRTVSRLEKLGVSIRNLQLDNYENDIKGIYSVARVAFEPNHYYTEINQDAFLELYTPYRDKIVPELVYIAELNGKTIGFVFGIPDYLQSVRNEKLETVVYKTIATLPQREFAGLGMWLSHLAHCQADKLGYKRFINALITSQSKLRYAEEKDTVEFRRYTLMGRDLQK